MIQRVKGFDPEAWQLLCRLYGPVVYRWVRRAGFSEDDASDIGQEVFQTVFVRITDFERRRLGSFRCWLRGITRNKIGDHGRRLAKLPVAEGGSDANLRWHQVAAPDSIMADENEGAAEREVFLEACGLIRCDYAEHTWDAFWRSAVVGQPSDEIAAELRMTPKAVRQAKYRILQRLRAEFGDLLED